MQESQQRRHDCNKYRTNQRNKFKDTGNNAHHETTRQTKKGKTQRAYESDDQAGSELRPGVSRKRGVHILKELIAAPAPAAFRQHLQCRASKTLNILQQEKGKNRNEDQPWKKG